MANDISQMELYRIINRAVARCSNHENAPVNTEIAIFHERYVFRRKSNHQLNIFENSVPHSREIEQAAGFCDDLEAYRLSTDTYAKENEPLSEAGYRRLYAGIERYRPYISAENNEALHALEINVKRHLPEFKNQLLLDEYNQKAARIHDLKLGYGRQRRQNQPAAKSYESASLHFFEDVLHNEELRQIEGCPEKLKLYAGCLKIVDCLPADKYNRTAKFKLKRDFNHAIRVTAAALGEGYLETAQKASYEEKRYHKAMERAKAFAEKPAKPSPVSAALRNKRAREEWIYR